jgi:hypothetical protein
MPNVAIVNRSHALTDAQIAAVVTPVQAAVTEDFAPLWTIAPTTLQFVGSFQAVPAGLWPIYVLDHSDVQGAGGYHEDTGPVPDGKVFAADALQYGISWTVDLTHELFEMLADPTTNRWVPLPGSFNQIIVEVGDPVEADQFGYLKHGVLITDFVLPAYFNLASGTQYDFTRRLTAPATALLPGGYLSLMAPDGTISQKFARQTDGSLSHRARRAGRLSRAGVV